MSNFNPMQPPQINWDLSTPIACEECGCETFVQVVYLRKISKLVAATDKDVVQPLPTFGCSKCGHVNSEFKIAGKKDEPKPGLEK